MHLFDEGDVSESQVGKFYSKLTPMVTDPIYQLHMTIMHQKNLIPSTFTTSKDIKIRQPGPEKWGVSKYTQTCGHPIVLIFILVYFIKA